MQTIPEHKFLSEERGTGSNSVKTDEHYRVSRNLRSESPSTAKDRNLKKRYIANDIANGCHYCSKIK